MLYGMLRSTTERLANDCALVAPDGVSISFRELLQAAAGFSRTLSASGIGIGDRVAVLLPNVPEFVVAAFATARVRGVLVPLNPQFPEHELQYYFRDCGPRVIIASAEDSERCARLASVLSHPCLVLSAADVAAAEVGRGHDPVPDFHAGDFLCQYSSGSTGVPKRVVRTQVNLIAEADNFHATVGLGSGDGILTTVPLFHAHGFGNCLLAAVRAGARMVLLEGFNRNQVMDRLGDGRVTVFPGVPFMFGILASSSSIPALPLGNLRLAFSAGASLPREVFDAFRAKFGVEVRQLYGSTETGSVCINLGSCEGELCESVGRPMQNVEVRIADPSGRAVAAGGSGEILVRSAAMTAGYGTQNQDAAGPQAFRDGFFHSADLGHLDGRGNLYVTGRKTLFIDTGGHKVDPVEIEAVLNRYTKVAASVVIGVKGRFGRQVVKAVIVPLEPCTQEEIVLWCRDRLADFKIPKIIEFRTEIPTSPLGKVLRKYLQDGL